ncbi:hypothetical protein IAT38_003540 [Cryptococcus sp. DSM 104549]
MINQSYLASERPAAPPAAKIVDPKDKDAVPPPSIVAMGTGVPSAPKDYAEPQQAATAPGSGGVVDSKEKLPFKEQVNGYAKKFAGATFGNQKEKEWGEKKLAGELDEQQ